LASTGVLSIKKLLPKYLASIGVISYIIAVKRTPSHGRNLDKSILSIQFFVKQIYQT